MLFHHRAVEARLAEAGCGSRIRTDNYAFKERRVAVTPSRNELVARQGNAPCSAD
jgi:hypothetical protein